MAKLKSYYDKQYFIKRDILDIRVAEALRILLTEQHLKTVLDVGCGTGWLVKYLRQAGFEAKGCDNAELAIAAASKPVRKWLVRSGATRLPFPKNSFDMVTSISVVEHITAPQVDQFLKEASRVLKPGGMLFLVTPNLTTPVRTIQGDRWFGYSDPTHINFYTPTLLAKQLKRQGYRHIKTEFKTIYNSSFDWDLPFIRFLPSRLKALAVYLLYSTKLDFIRNSFWMSGQKS